MSASHNPGGPTEDWGIKFNYSSGEPAPEKITDAIYGFTQTVDTLKMADIPDVDLSVCGVTKFGDFEVEVIDPVDDYLKLLKQVFDFDLIKSLLTRPDFKMQFDAMHAITGRTPSRFSLTCSARTRTRSSTACRRKISLVDTRIRT